MERGTYYTQHDAAKLLQADLIILLFLLCQDFVRQPLPKTLCPPVPFENPADPYILAVMYLVSSYRTVEMLP